MLITGLAVLWLIVLVAFINFIRVSPFRLLPPIALVAALVWCSGCGTVPNKASFTGAPGSSSGATSGTGADTGASGSGSPSAGSGSSGTDTGSSAGSGTDTGNTGSGGTSTGTSGSSNTAALKSITATSSKLASGSTLSVTATLSEPAPTGGAKLDLTSSKPAAANVPSSVMVAAGQTSVQFTVTAGSVSSDTSVLVTAAYNNTVAGLTITITAPAAPPVSTPITVTISPATASVVAGSSQQFTAIVTGSTNTNVSWTVSSGSISSTGLFTAPNVSVSTNVTVFATSQADPSVAETAKVTVTPLATPPPSGGGTGVYSGTGPIASWKAYQYLDTDGQYHQAIKISNAQGAYPVIGYSYWESGCNRLGDTFNDFWQPIGNGLWWFIHQPQLVYVKWVWYNNSTDRQVLQETPCIDYSGAPKYN